MVLASLSDRFTFVKVIRVFLVEYDRRRSYTDDKANRTIKALQIDKKSKNTRSNKASTTFRMQATPKTNFNVLTARNLAIMRGTATSNQVTNIANKQSQNANKSKRDLDASSIPQQPRY